MNNILTGLSIGGVQGKVSALTAAGGGSVAGSYMLVGIALVLLVLFFVANKFVQKRMGSAIDAALTYLSTRGLIGGIIIFTANCILNRSLPVIRVYSLLMAAMLSLFVCIYTILGFKIMSYGSLAVFTVFLMLGGMIVPYLYGVIFLDEAINAPRIIGIVLMVISMFLPLIGENRERVSGAADNAEGTDAPAASASRRIVFGVLCILVFLLNGMVSVISKTHAAGVLKFRSSDSMTFVMLCMLTCGAISGTMLAVYKLINRGKALRVNAADTGNGAKSVNAATVTRQLFRAALVFIALAALFDSASFFFQQLGAAALPASVMYPIMTGGSIVLTALAGFLIFKEKPSKIALIGLAITFISTFLFLF